MRPMLMTAILALAAALTGCSVQTLGAPKGSLTLTADFDDVQNLVVGHNVKIADVPVGSISQVKLIHAGTGYRSRVTMSIKDGIKVPVGTTAELSVTSLLGENFVRLAPPPGAELSAGPLLADNARLDNTRVMPAFEEVVSKAGPLLSAVSGNDLAGIVDATVTALGGKGERLNTMIKSSGQLLALFAKNREQLAAAVDDLAKLGQRLAKEEKALGLLPGNLARMTKLLSDDRDKILTTVRSLSALARTINDKILLGRTRELRRMVEQLGPAIGTLASDKTNLSRLITNLAHFVEVLPRAVNNGQLLAFPVIEIVASASGSAKKAKPSPDILTSLLKLLERRS